MGLQFFANGITAGCAYALVAIGFSLIYTTTKTFHFAHGAVFTLSAYLFYTLCNVWGLPLIAAFILVVGIIAIVGVLIDWVVYLPLVKQGSSQLVQLLSSLGLYIVIINLIAMVYGNEIKVLSPGIQTSHFFGKVILTTIQLATSLSFIVLFGALLVILRSTQLGKVIRALRDDPELLSVIGINPQKARISVFALGSAFAAIASILMGLDVGVDPFSGMPVVLTAAVAVIVGGVGFFEGAALGALLLGILQSVVIWQVSSRWQDVVTFFVLVLFLIFRPEGILGHKRRIEEVVI